MAVLMHTVVKKFPLAMPGPSSDFRASLNCGYEYLHRRSIKREDLTSGHKVCHYALGENFRVSESISLVR